jgi:GNAT superfamily N-acetyltransferase
MQAEGIEINPVTSWEPGQIKALYEIGGWLRKGVEPDPERIKRIISGSYVFIIAVDRLTGETIGMGRAISDGTSDAYIQDLVVKPSHRGRGIGAAIVDTVVQHCLENGITWIGLVAEPGTAEFYQTIGFSRMEGYIPMLHGRLNDVLVG